jgi:hypothetical protein
VNGEPRVVLVVLHGNTPQFTEDRHRAPNSQTLKFASALKLLLS